MNPAKYHRTVAREHILGRVSDRRMISETTSRRALRARIELLQGVLEPVCRGKFHVPRGARGVPLPIANTSREGHGCMSRVLRTPLAACSLYCIPALIVAMAVSSNISVPYRIYSIAASASDLDMALVSPPLCVREVCQRSMFHFGLSAFSSRTMSRKWGLCGP